MTNIFYFNRVARFFIDFTKVKSLFWPSFYQVRDKSQNWEWWVIFLYLIPLTIFPLLAMIKAICAILSTSFWARATLPIAVSAYQITLLFAAAACICNTIFGSIIAWVLVRYNFPGKKLLDSIIDLPFALPTSVAGLTIANMYGQGGWLNSYFSLLNQQDNVSSRFPILVAMIFVSFPFVVRTVQPVLQELDPHLEEAAWLMGASSRETFLRVLLPSLLPAVLTGMTLAFSRALGEFGSVVIVSSNLPFYDLVAPVLIFQRLEQQDLIGATVIGTVMLFLSLFLLLIVHTLQRNQQFM